MRPRLESCYFGPVPSAQWVRLSRALRLSAQQHCPGWQVSVEAMTPGPRASSLGIPSHAENSQKLDRWHEIVLAAPDGERLLLIDADTLILRPLDDVWDAPFDLAYTTRLSMFPLNAGVVFLRVSPGVRAFMTAWREENLRLLTDPKPVLSSWRRKYGGVNQASLARQLQTAHGLAIRELPCLEWNCEDTSWAQFDPAVTRIVHIKGALRKIVMQRQHPTPELTPLLAAWKQVDAAAGRLLARTA